MVETIKLRMAFRLSPSQGEIMRKLFVNDVVRASEIGGPSARVTMHHLRKVMHGYNITIRSQQWLGYWLEKEDKERVKVILDGSLPGQGEKTEDVPPVPQSDTASETPVAGG